MSEMSQREADKIAAAKKANSLHNLSEINMETVDDVQGIARDLQNENLFNPDDNVVLKNIFDGSTINGITMPKLPFTFSYNGVKYRTEPGQTFRLPGSHAYLFVKHLVSLIYRRLEGRDEMDKRTYSRNDKWVVQLVLRVDETLRAQDIDRSVEHSLPDYYAEDAEKGGRLNQATGQTGGGEVSLGAQLDDADMTDEQFEKIPDFNQNQNPNVQFRNGQPVDTRQPATTVGQVPHDDVAFPGARQGDGQSARIAGQQGSGQSGQKKPAQNANGRKKNGNAKQPSDKKSGNTAGNNDPAPAAPASRQADK